MPTEAGTDLWVGPKNGSKGVDWHYYEGLNNAAGPANDAWRNLYMIVNQANAAIRTAPEVTYGRPEDMKVLVAEARFLRAYAYSVLVPFFGNVTLTDENSERTNTPVRSTYEALYGQMVADLKAAAADPGVTPFQDNPARPTKNSALGLLARVYANGAGEGLEENGKSYWVRAKEAADDLINRAGEVGAHLYTDFADVFARTNNRDNLESLFEVTATNPMDQAALQANGSGQNIMVYFWNDIRAAEGMFGVAADAVAGTPAMGVGFNRNTYDTFYGRMNDNYFAPSKYLLDCFDARYDKRWENSFITALTTHSFRQAYESGKTNMTDPKPYAHIVMTITAQMCADYQLDPSLVGRKIYPYVDLGWVMGYSICQTPAKVWPKGEHGGDISKLVESKNVYAHPYRSTRMKIALRYT